MGYHNVTLPDKFSSGSLFGPSADVSIVSLEDSKQEFRSIKGPEGGRRVYDVSRTIADLDDLRELVEFHLARGGSLNTFPLKDWLDYATTATWTLHRDGDTVIALDDQDLKLVNGQQYQMVKRYTSGPKTIVRTITKPIPSTVLIGDSNGLVSSSNYTFNDQTGQVTFATGFTIRGQPTWGGQFLVPVRFADTAADKMQVAINANDTGSLDSVSLIEDVSPVVIPQDRPTGGSTNHGTLSSDFTLSLLHGFFQSWNPDASGYKLFLPTIDMMPDGIILAIDNQHASNTMKLRTAEDTVVTTIPADTGVLVYIGMDFAGDKTFFVHGA